jgi:hypothetical protein
MLSTSMPSMPPLQVLMWHMQSTMLTVRLVPALGYLDDWLPSHDLRRVVDEMVEKGWI